MSELFWFTGLVVWMGFAIYGAYLLCWIVWAALVAIDWVRWAIALNDGKTVWSYVPGVLLRKWLYFVAHGTSGTTWRGSRGEWNGFREWTVYPDPATKEPA